MREFICQILLFLIVAEGDTWVWHFNKALWRLEFSNIFFSQNFSYQKIKKYGSSFNVFITVVDIKNEKDTNNASTILLDLAEFL